MSNYLYNSKSVLNNLYFAVFAQQEREVTMQINLSELLSNDGASHDYLATVDMTEFKSVAGDYRIVEAKPFNLTITNIGKRKLQLAGEGTISLNIPCDRCLEDVKTDISFYIDRCLDLSEAESDRIEVDEEVTVTDNTIDVDELVYIEVLINIPDKTLCKEDCKGLCLKCGANLNQCECGCDRAVLDPRMSVIQDIFKNFKEV